MLSNLNTDANLIQCALGVSESHLDHGACEVPICAAITSAIVTLKQRAREAGFHLTIASGFRSFERQLTIWNNKVAGHLPVRDESENIIDISQLNEEEKLFAILRWSALPGLSRHHWGTDIDVFDSKDLPQDYSLQLTVHECENQFAPFYKWLDQYLMSSECDFFRPYNHAYPAYRKHCKIAEEPWHLSHRQSAARFNACIEMSGFTKFIEDQNISLKSAIVHHMEYIFKHYRVTE